MAVTLGELVQQIERLAPPRYAEPWDNVGLQVGDPCAEIQTILLAVDATKQVVDEGARKNAAALVAHHPLLFGEVRSVRSDRWPGRVLTALIEGRCGLYVAHTNLDAAPQTNTSAALARCLGLRDLQVLPTRSPGDLVAVLVRVEGKAEHGLLSDACRAGIQTRPASVPDGDCAPDERVFELVSLRAQLTDVVKLATAGTSGRATVLDVRPVLEGPPFPGLGVVGRCEPTTLRDLAARVRSALALNSLRLVPGVDGEVTRVAAVAGSAKGLLAALGASGAQAVVAGEIGHHMAVEAADSDLGAIEVGHFASEHPGVVHLAELLRDTFQGAVTIEVSADDRGPYVDP